MIVAIDTGGTKTLVTSFNKSGVMGEQIKFATPKGPKEYIKQLRDILSANYSGKPVDAIILAIPGVIKDGVVVWCGNLPWKNFHVLSELAGALKGVPIFIENDAKLAGLYEARILKPIPKQLLYVTVSTGIGTGIITEGHINPDLRNSEGGHSLIEYNGIVQEWQDFASGKAIYNTYGKYARDITSKRVWYQIADRISRGFLAIIPLLQPDAVVIGGSIGTYFDKFDDYLKGLLKEKLPEHIPCPKFIKARNSELAVIYGCYYYALDNLVNIPHKK
jgi:predicted NBD/HSP70 family sugar kinase